MGAYGDLWEPAPPSQTRTQTHAGTYQRHTYRASKATPPAPSCRACKGNSIMSWVWWIGFVASLNPLSCPQVIHSMVQDTTRLSPPPPCQCRAAVRLGS